MSLVQRRGAADLLKEDLLASIRFEVIHLGVGGLMSGRAAGITDFPSHLFGKSLTSRTLAKNARTVFPNAYLVLFAVSPCFWTCGSNFGFRTPESSDLSLTQTREPGVKQMYYSPGGSMREGWLIDRDDF